MQANIVWLDAAEGATLARLGGKGQRLAAMLAAGFPVPAGFCITTEALAECTETEIPSGLRDEIVNACQRLGADAVAVRSSATTEDLATASFAGQQDTFLNVRGADALLAAVLRVRASLWTERAVAYRRERGIAPDEAHMALVVQTMIPCDVAGVAFSVGPLSGARTVVIECAAGLGEAVVSGTHEVQRFRIERPSLQPQAEFPAGLLNEEQARQVAEAALALEEFFGSPQDVEWGFWQGRLYLFQSRPITAAPTGFFTETLTGDDHLWTSGFLNERFPEPVSPLGWSLVRELLEPLAFRDPLRFLRCRLPEDFPLLKLHHGHPYVNVRVFQTLYAPFPESLLPEDAGRYFPGGDTSLRRRPGVACHLWPPRLLVSLLCHFVRDPANWSPFHNWSHWASFTSRHDQTMRELTQRATELEGNVTLHAAMELIEEAQRLNACLLAIHRWSLTHADLFYSLLRRLLRRWLGEERGTMFAARLTSGVPNKSVELNCALGQVRTDADWRTFAAAYGHRSFSLDVFQPTFAESQAVVQPLIRASAPPPKATQLADTLTELKAALKGQGWRRVKFFLLSRLVRYARAYMPLREDQRFYWQRTLALERRLFLAVGAKLSRRADEVFFLTLDELRGAAKGEAPPMQLAVQRRREFQQLKQAAYPAFLLGGTPLGDEVPAGDDSLRGQPVSPGIAEGPVRILTGPGELGRLRPGDVVVTRAADPGWTVVFGTIAALVTETGGQLSHCAVVARECGLPAVAGVVAATHRLQEGRTVIVDGYAGTVTPVRP